jgi:hypothetical protein
VKERRHLDAVDAALDAARREAASAQIPPALRARILAAARLRETEAPRGRLLDFALRAVAVAAGIAAVAVLLPVPLEAAEFDANAFADLNARIAASVSEHLPRLDVGGAALPDAADAALPLGVGAAVLVVAGVLLARRGGRA